MQYLHSCRRGGRVALLFFRFSSPHPHPLFCACLNTLHPQSSLSLVMKDNNGTSNGEASSSQRMESMEVESLHHSSQAQQPQQQTFSPVYFLQALWALIVAYASYYRGASAALLAGLFILLMVVMMDSLASHHARVHHLTQDYSSIPSLLELKMAHIDHWCLQGGDNNCRCDDPTEPLSREETPGWIFAHRVNKALGEQQSQGMDDNWDVVLLGDEFIQDFTGRVGAIFLPGLKAVANYFNHTFTRNGGGNVEGVALGIAGDSISNLLWRIQHGELPDSKVYWIHIGTHDFDKGQCSEEAVLLGILRLAEEIHDSSPGSVIVINSILPRTPSSTVTPDLFGPIKEVNQQLEAFCVEHDHLVYFDASPLFVVNPVLQKKSGGYTLRAGMFQPDGVHLTLQGYKTWGNAILERLKLIIYEDDESSD